MLEARVEEVAVAPHGGVNALLASERDEVVVVGVTRDRRRVGRILYDRGVPADPLDELAPGSLVGAAVELRTPQDEFQLIEQQ